MSALEEAAQSLIAKGTAQGEDLRQFWQSAPRTHALLVLTRWKGNRRTELQ